MCGICGIAKPAAAVDEAVLTAMRDELVHRGPDDAGLLLEEGVGLGHRRLSILDLSAAGHQPMANEDGTLWLVFNGEIYNYRELEPQLAQAGHRFNSRSDSEVILHAYEEWGPACLERFIGMFAFALWDSQARRLFLARDHLGIKPLYYHFDAAGFYFASEIKAILKVQPGCRRPDYPALYDFLTLTRFDHDHTTLFAGVQQIRPGHYLEFEVDQWQVPVQKPYWHSTPASAAAKWDYSDPVGGFRDLFEESIRLQLRSDVPLGAFLSGGLDSSSIVALASAQLDLPLQTFSVAYEGAAYDERAFIDTVVDAFPVEHQRIMPGADKFGAELEAFVWAQEVPTNGPGPFSEWCVAQLARRQVKVALSGQGPDEMIGGYTHYFDYYAKTLFQRGRWATLLKEIGPIGRQVGRSPLYYLLAALAPSQGGAARRLKRALNSRIFTDSFKAYQDQVSVEPYAEPAGDTVLDRRLAETVTGWGLVRLLHYTDRNTMACSLEARVPFLDHRLVEYCMGLPFDMKIRGTSTKHVLRQAMASTLPAAIVERRDKKGFATPVSQWLRQYEEYVRDTLGGLQRRDLFKPGGMEKLLDEHMSGGLDRGWPLWRLLNVELWFSQFVDG